MTIKELERALVSRGVSLGRDVLYALAQRIPGATKESVRPGRMAQWNLPDDAPDLITEEMLVDATAAAGRSVPAARPAGPGETTTRGGLGDEEAELRRARVRLERQRLELDELELRERKDAVERRRGGAQAGGGGDVATFLLLERLSGLERKLDTVQGGGGQGVVQALITGLAPTLAPLVRDVVGARPGLSDLVELLDKRQPDVLALVGQLRDLGIVPATGGGAGALSSVRDLLEVLELAKPLLRRGGADESGVLTTLGHLAERLGPEVLRTWRETVAARERIEQLRAGLARPADAEAGVLQQLQAAALRGRDEGFPVVAEAIARLTGGHDFLRGVQAGQLGEGPALEILAQRGLVADARAHAYWRRFLHWLASTAAANGSAAPGPVVTTAAPPPPATPPRPPMHVGGPPRPASPAAAAVIGRCDRCGNQFEWPDEASWVAEQGDVCGELVNGARCTGRLLRVGAPAV